jgi:hypothetical protein
LLHDFKFGSLGAQTVEPEVAEIVVEFDDPACVEANLALQRINYEESKHLQDLDVKVTPLLKLLTSSQISQTIDTLNEKRRRRDFLVAFCADPLNVVKRALVSQAHDTALLRAEGGPLQVDDRRVATWEQPCF